MEIKDKGPIVLNDCQLIYSVHPGSILKEELRERGIKQKDFAKEIGMKAPHLSALIHGNRNVSTLIAAKLESALDIPASIWLNLQNRYNLSKNKEDEIRQSFLVDGYAPKSGTIPALGEPELDIYGVSKEIKLMLPKSDLPLLYSLANRMGWKVIK